MRNASKRQLNSRSWPISSITERILNMNGWYGLFICLFVALIGRLFCGLLSLGNASVMILIGQSVCMNRNYCNWIILVIHSITVRVVHIKCVYIYVYVYGSILMRRPVNSLPLYACLLDFSFVRVESLSQLINQWCFARYSHALSYNVCVSIWACLFARYCCWCCCCCCCCRYFFLFYFLLLLFLYFCCCYCCCWSLCRWCCLFVCFYFVTFQSENKEKKKRCSQYTPTDQHTNIYMNRFTQKKINFVEYEEHR